MVAGPDTSLLTQPSRAIKRALERAVGERATQHVTVERYNGFVRDRADPEPVAEAHLGQIARSADQMSVAISSASCRPWGKNTAGRKPPHRTWVMKFRPAYP